MPLMDEIVVVLNFEGHDADAEQCLEKVVAIAGQAGVYADPQNGHYCNFASNAGSDWAWKFTGTASSLKTFLGLIEQTAFMAKED